MPSRVRLDYDYEELRSGFIESFVLTLALACFEIVAVDSSTPTRTNLALTDIRLRRTAIGWLSKFVLPNELKIVFIRHRFYDAYLLP